MDKQEVKRLNEEIAQKMRDFGIMPEKALHPEPVHSSPPYVTQGCWEQQSPRDGNEKRLMRYDESLARVKALGMRHPTPAEVMAFLIADAEDKLNDADKKIAQNIKESFGEWLGIVMKRDSTLLHIYEHPELRWDDAQNKYVWICLKPRPSKTFKIGGLPSQEWLSLKQVSDACPELVAYLYSRPYVQLPKKIQCAYLYFDGEIWPAGRGGFYNDCIYCDDCNVRASRGYRP